MEKKCIKPHNCLKCDGKMKIEVIKDKKKENYKTSLICESCGYTFSTNVPLRDDIVEENLKTAIIDIWNSMIN